MNAKPAPVTDSETAPVPDLRRVFAAPDGSGGKQVAVFLEGGDAQARAAASGAPLSVFVQAADPTGLRLCVFTPTREKGSSDSAAIAALSAVQGSAGLLDVLEVTQGDPEAGGEVQMAQLCGGEWLLRQGVVTVQAVTADLSVLELSVLGLSGSGLSPAWVAGTGRPNLVAEVADLGALDAFVPDDAAVSGVNRATGTTGLILFCMGGPARADVSFRAFGPLKGFTEDAASSNMLACLTGVLGHLGRLPADSTLIRAAQRRPGQPARLSAQYAPADGGTEVWVGGRVTPV
ncbi:PhzF family phenazine biosynthesis protein [Deinococcus aquaticus]|uniref:PhzF family phenazine biosynthesis protein n=1 Tax=Deinococcus aquaticus TaxID=328692 RepID=A0ABY7UYM1_9DEIO|nr:PhzF family phenazine biosynthesis protein [Deinococcus aquaticus]WDA57990.1 PhzF family phenazine biosynthesis protein [Deinococcus aquaticus]